MANKKIFNLPSVKTLFGAAGMLLALSAGAAMAGSVSVTSVSTPNGLETVNIMGTYASGIDGGGSNLNAGTIGLQTSIGALNTYCVDLFHYISPGNNSYTYNSNAISTSATYVAANGSTVTNWTASQLNLLNALLSNGSLQPQTTLNTAALQVAIWDVEYDTAAANGTYNVTSQDSFYFSATDSSSTGSQGTLAQAQTYLNDATGYLNGSTFVGASWLANSAKVVDYLTSTSNPLSQNLIYLASVPEPSSVILLGVGLTGLWAARHRKLI